MNLIEQIKINDTSIDGYQGTYYTDNPEYVQVTTDVDGKILEGIKSDGSKYITGNLIVDGSIYSDSLNVEQIVEEIQERVDEVLDSAEETLSYFETSDSPEWLQVTIDSEGKVLEGIKKDGTIYNSEIDSISVKVVSIEQDNRDINSRIDYYNFQDFSVNIPSIVYLRTSLAFLIWYRNVIHGSQAFYNGNYSIRCQELINESYREIGEQCTYERFNYVSSTTTEFDLEIRIYETYTQKVVFSKVVHFIVKNPANVSKRNPSIVILGDSYTDNYGVSSFVYDFLEEDNFNPISIGVNDAENGWKDDAWGGYTIWWFATGESGGLRDDRPLDDAIWDAGWGKDEPNGWTEGQTYDDLTPTQRHHGKTKNEFYNPNTKKFDFSYYMSTYHSGVLSVDVVVLNIGFNDTTLQKLTDTGLAWELSLLDEMIQSIHEFDVTTKVILCETCPVPYHNDFTSSFTNKWNTADKCKFNQEFWNDALIKHFDNVEYRNNNVYIAPLASNIDSTRGMIHHTIPTNKFDTTITEIVSDDFHPNELGAKYIADTIVNTIEGVL